MLLFSRRSTKKCWVEAKSTIWSKTISTLKTGRRLSRTTDVRKTSKATLQKIEFLIRRITKRPFRRIIKRRFRRIDIRRRKVTFKRDNGRLENELRTWTTNTFIRQKIYRRPTVVTKTTLATKSPTDLKEIVSLFSALFGFMEKSLATFCKQFLITLSVKS